MTRLIICLLFSALAVAQNAFNAPIFRVDCGAPDDAGFTSGSAAWTQADMGPGPLSTMRFGVRFSYRIALPPGAYLVRFVMVEPNATAIGQRRFTIAVNSQVSDPIDVLQAVGPRPNVYNLDTVAVSYFGRILIDFQGLAGNAIINAIEVYPSPDLKIAEIIQWQTCDRNSSGVGFAITSRLLMADPVRTNAFLLIPGNPLGCGALPVQ